LLANQKKKDKINYILLAQTIALGLNIGMDRNLRNFKLKRGTFAVALPYGGCASNTS
jgi:hypothetical protein